MAQFDTVRTAGVGVGARIDEGLRAHMNKVYGLMSVAMLITGAAAWAVSGLAVTSDPTGAAAQIGANEYLTSFGYALYASPLKWLVMFQLLRCRRMDAIRLEEATTMGMCCASR